MRDEASWILAMGLSIAACGDEGDGRSSAGGGGIGSVDDGGDGGATDGDGGDAGDADDDGDGGDGPGDGDGGDGPGDGDGGNDDDTPSFDLGSADDGDLPVMEAGCQAVDFLFVVDNSVSMENNQAALVGAFPGFMDAIQATLEADSDYHILVTDTDEWGRCTSANGFLGMDPNHETCNNYIETTAFVECDRTRGAGVVHPAGQFATNAPCVLAGANRYIVPEEPDLATAFSCVATVGTAGHPSERPMNSMTAALAPGINGPGGCNEGFLRSDALLVITFMSDDPHHEDEGNAMEWYQAVLDAKGGDPTAVVVLGLTPAWPGCSSGNNDNGEHWAEFVGLWNDHGLHGNICGTAEEFVAFFQAAVSTIDQACDEFEPPG